MSILNTAVSGMLANTNWLSTIAQNVANANTTGYKNVETEFATLVDSARLGLPRSAGVTTSDARAQHAAGQGRRHHHDHRPRGPGRRFFHRLPIRRQPLSDPQRLLRSRRQRQSRQLRRLLPDGPRLRTAQPPVRQFDVRLNDGQRHHFGRAVDADDHRNAVSQSHLDRDRGDDCSFPGPSANGAEPLTPTRRPSPPTTIWAARSRSTSTTQISASTRDRHDQWEVTAYNAADSSTSAGFPYAAGGAPR